MNIQQVIVDDLTEEQAHALHELFESGDVEAIEAKLRELGVKIPEGGETVRIERVERKRRIKATPEEVVLIADSLAAAQNWPLLTEFLNVNALMIAGHKLDPQRLVKLMADLTNFMIERLTPKGGES